MWVCYGTGALAAMVVTKFKGKGRWIKTWAHWEDPDLPGSGKSFTSKSDCKWIGKVEVEDWLHNLVNRI